MAKGATTTTNPPVKSNAKKIAITIGIIAGVIVIGIVLLIVFVFTSSKKLVCTSDKGDITLYYNDSSLVGYKTKNLSYDFDNQKELAKEMGIDKYIDAFEQDFEANYGTCERK